MADQLLTQEQQGRVKIFLYDIFELSKGLMLSDSLKVSVQAGLTILTIVESMERGRLSFEQQYPNGMQDVASMLTEPLIEKL